MFGFGKRKVTQAEFEVELTRLLSAYQDWQGGDDRDATPTLVTRLSEFKRINPESKASERVSRLLRDVIENQVKAISYFGTALDKQHAENLAGYLKDYRTAQTYLAKTNRAAEVLIGQVKSLEASDRSRRLLMEAGFSEERLHAVRFLKTLHWCFARQMLATEEWNDALVLETGARLGNELAPSPSVTLTTSNAPRLLPIADRRLGHAQVMKDKFASLIDGFDFGVPTQLGDTIEFYTTGLAVMAWVEAFSLYERQCEATVQDLQSLIDGTPTGSTDERALAVAESQAVGRAVARQREVMWAYSDDPELDGMYFEAMNQLRHELGKAPISAMDFFRLSDEDSPIGSRLYTDSEVE